MKYTSIVFAALVAPAHGESSTWSQSCSCLTDTNASELAAAFTIIAAEHPGCRKVAVEYFVDGFSFISDRVSLWIVFR